MTFKHFAVLPVVKQENVQNWDRTYHELDNLKCNKRVANSSVVVLIVLELLVVIVLREGSECIKILSHLNKICGTVFIYVTFVDVNSINFIVK